MYPLATWKFRIFFCAAGLLLIALLFPIDSQAQKAKTDEMVKIEKIHSLLKTYHIEAKELTRLVPDRIISRFSENLDPESQYLIKPDLELLESFTSKLSGNFPVASMVIVDHTDSLLTARFDYLKAMLNNQDTLDFYLFDTVRFDPVHFPRHYSSDLNEFRARWQKNLKYLSMILYLNDSTKTVTDRDKVNQELNELLVKTAAIELCKIDQILNQKGGLRGYILDAYLNAIAESFDPHSQYFSLANEESFESSLSSQLFTTGLFLAEKSPGEIVVSYIVPESHAWELKTIEVGDEILNVRYKEIDSHPACVGSEKLYEVFHSTEVDSLELLIRSQKSGQAATYRLQKRFTKNTSNQVDYFVLKDSTDQFGYISFPSFYAGNSANESQSSEDLAKILLAFKLRKVPGVILDLRGNGGGSIEEAIRLAGFFIDQGPLLWSQSTMQSKPILNMDLQRGTVYTGKLMILTNNLTASASEMLIVALKDYQNLVTVGTKTYGKATGQELVPMGLDGASEPFGYLKITTLKLFGLDGKTYQGSGIDPMINLPDPIPDNMISESLEPFSLRPKNVDNRVKAPHPADPVPLAQLQERHQERLKTNQALAETKKYKDSLQIEVLRPLFIPLQMEQFAAFYRDAKPKEILQKEPTFVTEDILKPEKRMIPYEELKKFLLQDPILNEAFLIFKDWENEISH